MENLVRHLLKSGVLKTKSIIDAFQTIDRKNFVSSGDKEDAYGDHPLSIGFDQTISQPTTVAFMLGLLSVAKGNKVLDVGSGSGWTTALLAHLAGTKGAVYGVEIVPELVSFGAGKLAKYDFQNAEIFDASATLGLPTEAPFDKILVSAAGRAVPEELLSQLKVGGTMVMPVKDAIWKIQKISEAETEIEKYEGFRFVPLIH